MVWKRYYKLFEKSVKQTVFSSGIIKTVALITFIMSFISTYVVVSLSEKIKSLISSFHTENIQKDINLFINLSLLLLFMKYVPKIVYNWFLQQICRKQFVIFIKEYLMLDYTNFHKKSPGKIRYAIFLKSFASVMCAQILVFEVSAMIGTSFFSFLKVTHIINFRSGIIFIFMPIIYLSAVMYFIYIRTEYQINYLKESEKVSGSLYDKLINFELIKTFNLEEKELESFYKTLLEQMKTQCRLGVVDARGIVLLNCLQMVLYVMLVVLAFYTNSNESNKGLNNIQAIILYTNLSHQLKRMGREMRALAIYLTQIRFSDIEINSTDQFRNTYADEQKPQLVNFHKSIEFENVGLLYNNEPVVININEKIIHGEKIAIVGPNGTGKSTFIKALLGFTKFTGKISFDGQTTEKLQWKSILKNISYVPQKDCSSNDTVINNLRLGNKNANDDFIKKQAKLFNADLEFENLSNGYETVTGPRGNNLSGGQLQKISLVRAAVKNAPIFILDEPTSATDKKYEFELIERLMKNFKDKTILMIVHGKKYLEKFDRIYFFNNGKLEATGPYNKLIKESENFRNFIF